MAIAPWRATSIQTRSNIAVKAPDRAAAWDTLCRVFGWGPSPWLNDLAKRHGVKAPPEARAGDVVFHDAWPASWPRWPS